MSWGATKISRLLFLVGLFGVLTTVVLGQRPEAEYVLEASFGAIALAGLIILGYAGIVLYQEFTGAT